MEWPKRDRPAVWYFTSLDTLIKQIFKNGRFAALKSELIKINKHKDISSNCLFLSQSYWNFWYLVKAWILLKNWQKVRVCKVRGQVIFLLQQISIAIRCWVLMSMKPAWIYKSLFWTNFRWFYYFLRMYYKKVKFPKKLSDLKKNLSFSFNSYHSYHFLPSSNKQFTFSWNKVLRFHEDFIA